MKQNTPAVYLQISTAQGQAECRIFARFVLGKLLAEAQAKGIDAELVNETADKHGILSATLKLEGRKPKSWRKLGRGRSNGYASALFARNIRAKIGI